MSSVTSEFRLNRHDRIGAEAAEDDDEFLFDCFVDSGDLAVLRDTRNAQRILLGRTGSGKTALIRMLCQAEQRVSQLSPEDLALTYLADSSFLRDLEDSGIRLHNFYRLLWKHVLVLEFIKLHWPTKNEQDQQTFWTSLKEIFKKDRAKEEALGYLREYGERYWIESEVRIKEIVDKFENQVSKDVGLDAKVLKARLQGRTSNSTEQKMDLVDKVQRAVDSIQIQKLNSVVSALADSVFADATKQPRFFVVIDRFDEAWVEDGLRFRLLRTLIEAVRELKKFERCKIVVALRHDLWLQVLSNTRDPGFQEEKLQPLMLHLRWNDEQLFQIADKRIQTLVRRRYTKQKVGWDDIFPAKVHKQRSREYLIQRTLKRPRDIIQFVNSCIELAPEKATLTQRIVREAEAKYSELRLRSLCDEWRGIYPNLMATVRKTLTRRRRVFHAREIDDDNLLELSYVLKEAREKCPITDGLRKAFDVTGDMDSVRLDIVRAMYRIGLIGLGLPGGVAWSFEKGEHPDDVLTSDTKLYIAPPYFRTLAVNDGVEEDATGS